MRHKKINILETEIGDLVVFGKNETILVFLYTNGTWQPLTATTVVNKEAYSFLYENPDEESPVSVKHHTKRNCFRSFDFSKE